MILTSTVSHWSVRVTDRQTDRRTGDSIQRALYICCRALKTFLGSNLSVVNVLHSKLIKWKRARQSMKKQTIKRHNLCHRSFDVLLTTVATDNCCVAPPRSGVRGPRQLWGLQLFELSELRCLHHWQLPRLTRRLYNVWNVTLKLVERKRTTGDYRVLCVVCTVRIWRWCDRRPVETR